MSMFCFVEGWTWCHRVGRSRWMSCYIWQNVLFEPAVDEKFLDGSVQKCHRDYWSQQTVRWVDGQCGSKWVFFVGGRIVKALKLRTFLDCKGDFKSTFGSQRTSNSWFCWLAKFTPFPLRQVPRCHSQNKTKLFFRLQTHLAEEWEKLTWI